MFQSLHAYLRKTIDDPLFIRVFIFLWGLPLALLAIYFTITWQPESASDWAFMSFILWPIGCIGLYLIYVSVSASQKTLKKAGNWMSDGSEVAGIVLALIVSIFAIPITAFLRMLMRKHSPKQ